DRQDRPEQANHAHRGNLAVNLRWGGARNATNGLSGRGQRLGYQGKRLADYPIIPCGTTNLAITGVIPVRLAAPRSAGGHFAERVTPCPTAIGSGPSRTLA